MPAVATDVGNAGTAVTSQAALITAQSAAALVPAGLPAGEVTTLIYGNATAGNATSIIVSIGSSTTVVVSTTKSSSKSGSSATGTGAAAGSGSESGSSGTATGSAAKSSASGNAGAHVVVASGALLGAGAFFAAFL